MEGVLAVLACLVTGASAMQLSLVATDGSRPALSVRARAGVAAKAAAGLFETVGHRVAVIRISNRPQVSERIERLRACLRAHGLSLSKYGCCAFVLIGSAAAAAAGVLVSRSALGAVVCAAGFGCALVVLTTRHEAAALDAAARQMPEVLRSFSTALGSGKSLSQAVEHVGRNAGEPLGPEFLRASFEIAGGRSVVSALDDLCARVEAPGLDILGTALAISRRTGAPLDDLFARTSRMVSDTVALKRELEVKTSQARLSAKVVAALPLLLVGVLTLLSPDYRAGLATAAGVGCLFVAALLDLTALAIIRSLMRAGTA